LILPYLNTAGVAAAVVGAADGAGALAQAVAVSSAASNSNAMAGLRVLFISLASFKIP